MLILKLPTVWSFVVDRWSIVKLWSSNKAVYIVAIAFLSIYLRSTVVTQSLTLLPSWRPSIYRSSKALFRAIVIIVVESCSRNRVRILESRQEMRRPTFVGLDLHLSHLQSLNWGVSVATSSLSFYFSFKNTNSE